MLSLHYQWYVVCVHVNMTISTMIGMLCVQNPFHVYLNLQEKYSTTLTLLRITLYKCTLLHQNKLLSD